MRTCVCFAAVVGSIVFILSGSVLADSTNLVYTYSGHFDLRIPADPIASRGWMQDAIIEVPRHLTVVDLDVSVSIRHTSAFDLQLFLEGPSGRTIVLSTSDPSDGYYEGADYSVTTFDDEADVQIEDGEPPFAGCYRPMDSLTVFDGRDAYGPWKLRVYDAFYADTGCLEFFGLRICVAATDGPTVLPAPSTAGLALLGLTLMRARRHGRT